MKSGPGIPEVLAASGPIVVLSPHLDDAVLSIGGLIADLTRRGVEVRVVTVLAGDPDSVEPAGEYDRSCGFQTAGEAALARQIEDARACAMIGAEPLWLPYWDGYYSASGASVDTILRALATVVADAGAVFLPGFPLLHSDHRWLTTVLLANLEFAAPIYLYVEQPYAMSRFFGSTMRVEAPWRGVTRGLNARRRKRLALETPSEVSHLFSHDRGWATARPSFEAQRMKNRAIGAYTSQLSKLGPLVRTRLAIYEWCWGGEAIAAVASPDTA